MCRAACPTALQDPPNLRSALHTDPSHCRGPSRGADDHHGSLQRTSTPAYMQSLYTLHSKRHPRVETTTALQDPPNLRSALHTDPSHCRGPSRYADDHHGSLQRTWTPA